MANRAALVERLKGASQNKGNYTGGKLGISEIREEDRK